MQSTKISAIRGSTQVWVAVVGALATVAAAVIGILYYRGGSFISVTAEGGKAEARAERGEARASGGSAGVATGAKSSTMGSDPNRSTTESSSLGVMCDDALKRSAAKRLTAGDGTKSIPYFVAPHPCPRELTIYLSGRAISTEPTGARTGEYVVSDGTRDLCKASASLAQGYKDNVEFSTGQSVCKVDIAANQGLTLVAEMKSSNKSEPLSVSLIVDAAAR